MKDRIRFSFIIIALFIIANCEDDCERRDAKVKSYHLHIMFLKNNEDNKNGALELRRKFSEVFGLIGKKCTTLFDNEESCLFDPEFVTAPTNPYVTSQWGVFISLQDFNEMVLWIMQNRNFYDFFLHPNTGCLYTDHADRGMWGGNPWPLDYSVFPKSNRMKFLE